MKAHHIKSTSFFPLTLLMAVVLTSCSQVKVETKDNFDAVDLPDGSQVYLNRNSAVSYDKDFKTRNIELEGEAFFSVVPGETPFVVKTSEGEIDVVGTEFNVKAEAKALAVEVEEGVVDLKTAHDNSKLKEGEMAVYNEGKVVVSEGKSAFRVWMQELKIEFKKLGREFKKGGKEVGREFKKGGKAAGKEFKKAGKDLRDAVK
jgi:ferric-dicitrate binding protein FerR (iron transport regulator)